MTRLGIAVVAGSLSMGATAAAQSATAEPPQGELRVRWDAARANARGPLAQAQAWTPSQGGTAEAEVRAAWRHGAYRLSTEALLQATHPEGGPGHTLARFNEFAIAGDHGAWQTTAGRKVVSWDVGQAFRPNDLVQQEARRSLLPTRLQGRPVLQAEYFEADAAAAVVWVNPHHVNAPVEEHRGPEESAWVARMYGRTADGTADVYAFGRLGRHTGASLGAATAWVANDRVEIHASARALQRHDGWTSSAGPDASLATANPWRITTLGRTAQALLGASWTGEAQQSVLLEGWYDGTAPSDAQWRDWGARNGALAAAAASPGAPAAAVAGNLAWQASPLAGVLGAPALRRQNLFVRLAWQPGAWTTSLDAWFSPTDGGRAITAAVKWQGDRISLQAALRQIGGPDDAVLAQLPARRSAALLATWSF